MVQTEGQQQQKQRACGKSDDHQQDHMTKRMQMRSRRRLMLRQGISWFKQSLEQPQRKQRACRKARRSARTVSSLSRSSSLSVKVCRYLRGSCAPVGSVGWVSRFLFLFFIFWCVCG